MEKEPEGISEQPLMLGIPVAFWRVALKQLVKQRAMECLQRLGEASKNRLFQ